MQMKAKPRTKTKPPAGSPEVMEHVVLYDVPWEGYTRLLDAFGDRRLRHSYLRGTFEIMSPLKRHDSVKKILARMVEMIAFLLELDIQSIGSTTLRKEDAEAGLEPDECYYFANEPKVRGKPEYEADSDPPPDLAIEVDLTHGGGIIREEIYASLGVPEVWRWQDEQLVFFKLQKGKYRPIKSSSTFSNLRPADLQVFLDQRHELGEGQLIRQFADWVKQAPKLCK